MLTGYDYLGIFFYIAFIVGVGLFYSRKSKNTSDYFRGGGVMPWWITGAAAWMGSFSAWTFTGAAGKIYETGPYVLCLYFASLPSLFLVLAFVCFRFRRMRVVTPLEAVRLRFGQSSQQFYTWIRLPFLIFFSGVGLNAVGVFMAAIFKIDITVTLVGLGLVVVIVSMLGGTFAVAASDFVQMFLVVTVAMTTAFLALRQPEVGGVAGLLERVPSRHFEWGQIAHPGFILMWVLALALNNIIGASSIENSSKFLMTRSDRHARLMLIIPIAGTLLGPLIWLVPPMVTAVTHPNLAGEFPILRFPHEAAFLATALDVLPNGMLGLLICGIFAATLTGLDAGLNQAAGIYVRNFHLPIINPQCSEKNLLWISKGCTAIFGVLIIGIAVVFNHFRSLSLFDLLNQLGVSLWLPLAIPLAVGLFYKRTPAWSTWSTVIIGLATSFAINRLFSGTGTYDAVGRTLHWVAVNAEGVKLSGAALKQLGDGLTGVGYVYQGPAWLEGLLNGGAPLLAEEVVSFSLILTVAVVAVACVGWFFFTTIFYERSTPEYKAAVEEFAGRLRQPMGERAGEEIKENTTIELSIGRLCLIYGASVLLMAAIPNPAQGRLAFIFCGGVMALVGGGLMWHYRTKLAKSAGLVPELAANRR